MKKLCIKTYGCQMNVYDSQKMADLLKPFGYSLTENTEEADLVILNTCHIREKAEEKVFSELGRLKSLKDKGGHIVVAGCVAQAAGEAILARAPFVDAVVGPQSYQQLPELLSQLSRKSGIVLTDFAANEKFDSLQKSCGIVGPSVFLSIQEGCDKFCTFCVVPYTRGAEFSRPALSILEEAKTALQHGAKEIVLLGQNVNAYHGEGLQGHDWGLGRLIREIADLEGLERIRYMTSHPRDMQEDLMEAHRDVPQLMPFLHLPVQSGSDRILKAMNRKHTAEDYIKLIDKIRSYRPDIAFSSDFIVGFPGEADEDFDATLRLIEKVSFAQAYSFKYSPRPGTPASVMEKPVPEEVKDSRLAALQSLLWQQQKSFNESFVGKSVDVLFEKKGKKPGQYMGKTPHMQSVIVEAGRPLEGRLLRVEISEAHQNSLNGTFSIDF